MPNDGKSKPPGHENADRIRLPDEAALVEAAHLISAGDLVAFPTETVYGLGGDATNGEAVARIFAAKGRPAFNPLIVHVADFAHARQYGQFPDAAAKLAAAFWPGPLTLVVPHARLSAIADLVSAGLPTLALRCPDHPIARALLVQTGRPLAAPSANRSGHVSATRAEHVAADLGNRVAMILDGGPTAHGLESTILDATGETITLLRPGAVPAYVIEAVLGKSLARKTETATRPTSPGQLASHYAPRAKLRLEAREGHAGEALLAFGIVPAGVTGPAGSDGPVINLSPSGDLIEAAANLFAALRKLDATGVDAIAVMPIPSDGLGEAINDRLRRAAAPRG